MITDVPDANSLRDAAIELLNMAWNTGLEVFRLLSYVEAAAWDEDGSARRDYDRARQPALRHAHVLVHQAQELGLKAAIAEVSPYLLLAAEPRLWPRPDEKGNISFADMRTIDAADLLRMHAVICVRSLPADFVRQFEAGRRTRNKIVHLGGAGIAADAKALLLQVLTTADVLVSDRSWPEIRYESEQQGAEAVIGAANYETVLLSDFALLQEVLEPRYLRRFFGYDRRQRSFACLPCTTEERENGSPSRFAQLDPNDPTLLHCPTCCNSYAILREPCSNPSCRCDVLWAQDYKVGTCLTCCHQDKTRHARLIDAWFATIETQEGGLDRPDGSVTPAVAG